MITVPPIPPPTIEYVQLTHEPERWERIHLYDVLMASWLEEYFRNLTNIKRDILYILRSWNTFKVTYDGIVFTRKGKKELRSIEAKNKGAGLRINWLEYSSEGRKIWITAVKLWVHFKQEEAQILPTEEIAEIFTCIESEKTYTRPSHKKSGEEYKLILAVKQTK